MSYLTQEIPVVKQQQQSREQTLVYCMSQPVQPMIGVSYIVSQKEDLHQALALYLKGRDVHTDLRFQFDLLPKWDMQENKPIGAIPGYARVFVCSPHIGPIGTLLEHWESGDRGVYACPLGAAIHYDDSILFISKPAHVERIRLAKDSVLEAAKIICEKYASSQKPLGKALRFIAGCVKIAISSL